MHSKYTTGQLKFKRPQTTCLRRKIPMIKPLRQQKDCQSPLLPPTQLQQQLIHIPKKQSGLFEGVLQDSSEHQFQKMNKIYNKTGRKMQILGDVCKNKSRASVNFLGSSRGDSGFYRMELRPKSSNNTKVLPGAEIFRAKKEVNHYQNRPGSSKSSRLFKRKSPMDNDPVNAENQDFEPVIRVTSMNSSRVKNNKAIKERVSTSLNPVDRRELFAAKLDPHFYKLFAQ